MTTRIAVFYGSDTGNTQLAAEKIVKELGDRTSNATDVDNAKPQDLIKYDLLFIGVSTWNVGEMQADMEDFLSALDKISLKDNKVALFGLGDAVNYPDNYLDAMGDLWINLKKSGAELVGLWPIDGYNFNESLALYEGDEDYFVGLALDEDNEPELTDERIEEWVHQVLMEVGV